MAKSVFLTDARFQAEVDHCLHCKQKPCVKACPVGCSPYRFIQAIKTGEKSDYRRATEEILSSNSLGGICGLVCYRKFCMSACTLGKFDHAVNIPAIQAKIIQKAKELGVVDIWETPEKNGKKIAIIGAGPSGLTAGITLAQKGYEVDIYEKESKAGGACRFIAEDKLPIFVIDSDVDFILKNKNINFKPNTNISSVGELKGYDSVIVAVGINRPDSKKDEKIPDMAFYYSKTNKSSFEMPNAENIFATGDFKNGATSVVEAVASGKNVAFEVDSFLSNKEIPKIESNVQNNLKIHEAKLPVSLETDFFGKKISSPFLLSAAPPTDGYEQMKKAYEAGWVGGIMKTAFDDVPIHIPAEYMFRISDDTYGNCDNVSGHPLKRVCEEVSRLVKEFPDKLTIASTGGPVTGNDEEDKKQWQKNTKMLEQAGAMAVEYSLSCPQGGDGTEGNIVSQNPALSAKIIDWVMECSNPDIPKIFKLTAQVTSIKTIANAIKKVYDKYPNKKAGITLANSFPSMCFRKGYKEGWEQGVVVGMSGRGVVPISNLSLSTASDCGLVISGNGGPMNYLEATNFLALGAKNVQFCTLAMRDGLDVIDELNSGLSYFMKERGINSVEELIGIANRTGDGSVTDFMNLSPVKKIPTVDKDLCIGCGCCSRCSYFGITADEDGYPIIHPENCIGCSICVRKCISGALTLRNRTEEETKALKH